MNRRTALACVSAGLVGGFGGCLGRNTGEQLDGEMHLSLTAVDDGPEPLAFEINLLSEQLTTRTVPKVDITVKNTGNREVSWVQADSTTQRTSEIVFPARDTTPNKLAVGLESEIADRLVENGTCARIEQDIDRTGVPTVTELAPGDEMKQRYAIAARGQQLNGQCPPADRYRAEWEYEEYGTWGFELELT